MGVTELNATSVTGLGSAERAKSGLPLSLASVNVSHSRGMLGDWLGVEAAQHQRRRAEGTHGEGTIYEVADWRHQIGQSRGYDRL